MNCGKSPHYEVVDEAELCLVLPAATDINCAAPGCAAHQAMDWIPAQQDSGFGLLPLKAGGAIIFRQAAGPVPGLKGGLHPEQDVQDRTFLYAANLSINEGMAQSVHFSLGGTLQLEDVHGTSHTHPVQSGLRLSAGSAGVCNTASKAPEDPG